MRVLIVAALLLALTLAAAPVDAKPDPPQCVWEGPVVTVGPVTVSSRCGEGPRVEVNEDCLRLGAC